MSDPAVSRIVISFRGPGSAQVNVEAENVVPEQIYLAAKVMEYVANRTWAQLVATEMANRKNGLAVVRAMPGGVDARS